MAVDRVWASQIGAWLRAKRRAQGVYSIERASKIIDVSFKSVERWELGRTIPVADKLLALAVLYDAVDDLPDIAAKWERVTAKAAGTRRAG